MTNVSEVLFYERPVPLNRESHKDLRIKPILNLAFSAKAHSVPLAGVEFPLAAHSFPILFAGASKDQLNPVALLGVRQDENLLVNDEGHWAPDNYIPAFIRRYPFVLAEAPKEEGGEGENNFAVFLDEAFEGFGTEEGERLFNEDGSEGEALKQAVGFLGDFQQHIVRTEQFMKKLQELDLLAPRNIEVRMPEQDSVLNGLYVVDGDKLQALSPDVLHGLMQEGFLSWIYAHLFSMATLDGLIRRMHERFTPEEREKFDAKMKAASEARKDA